MMAVRIVLTMLAVSVVGACGYDQTTPVRPANMEQPTTTMIHLDDGTTMFVDKPPEEVVALLNEGGVAGRGLLREIDAGVYVVPNRVTALE